MPIIKQTTKAPPNATCILIRVTFLEYKNKLDAPDPPEQIGWSVALSYPKLKKPYNKHHQGLTNVVFPNHQQTIIAHIHILFVNPQNPSYVRASKSNYIISIMFCVIGTYCTY